jgi:glycosyltransferase involved in cell wall biosynthesis
MNPLLSIVITSLNEQDETNLTIDSIRRTAGNDVEIIVVDDFSDEPVKLNDKRTILHRNAKRIGVGGSRHLAATFATASHLLLTDAHMRFEPKWLNNTLHRIVGRPSTIHCGACLGLDEEQMDITKHKGMYCGATLCIHNPQTNEIFEGKWIDDKLGQDDYEIACLMGASYFVPKEFFFKIRGLAALKMWGCDEPYLSVKTWLSGGEIRMMKTVRIGHKFRNSAPYVTGVPNLVYNKIRCLTTLFDPSLANFLINKIPKNGDFIAAMQMIEKDKKIIDEHTAYYRDIFIRDIYWYANKFNIKMPDLQPTVTPIPALTLPVS